MEGPHEASSPSPGPEQGMALILLLADGSRMVSDEVEGRTAPEGWGPDSWPAHDAGHSCGPSYMGLVRLLPRGTRVAPPAGHSCGPSG